MTHRRSSFCLLGLLASAGLLMPACGEESGSYPPQCTADPDCPPGTRCVGGACERGEYSPLPRPDLGVPEDLGQDTGPGEPDLGPPDQGVDLGPNPADGGDAGPVEGEGEGEGLGEEILPLELNWLEPAELAQVEGAVELRFQVASDPRYALRLLTVTVDGVIATQLGRPATEAELTVLLPTTEFPDGRRLVAATLQDLGGRVASTPARPLLFVNEPERLQVVDGRFMLDGTPLGQVGVQYEIPAEDDRLDGDLAAMAGAGLNLVRVAAPAAEVEPAVNEFTTEGCRPVNRLLERAEAHGLRVLLELPAWTDYPYLQPVAGVADGPAALLWDPKLRSALARRHSNLLERCGWSGQETLAALSLWQHPRVGAEQERTAAVAVAAWETWSLALHGGNAAARVAAWGPEARFDCGDGRQACPPATAALCDPASGGELGPARQVVEYRQFLAETGQAALQDLAIKVGQVDPMLLLTARFDAPLAQPVADERTRCATDGGGLDPRALSPSLDFLLIDGRPWQGVLTSPDSGQPLPPEQVSHTLDFEMFELSALWARADGQRPVVLTGFSGDASLAGGGQAGEALQAAIWARVLRSAQELALGGVLGASWRDPGDGPRTGLITPEGQSRAALTTLQQAAAGVRQAAPWTPDSWVMVPQEQVHHLPEAFVQAQPFYLPLRTNQKQPGATGCTLAPGLNCADVRGCTDLCP